MRKPYRQGFNPSTGDILVVCSWGDVQAALARDGRTITKRRAIQLMRANEEALTYAYQHGWEGEWAQSIRDVLYDQVKPSERTTRLKY